jgi:hypothetical protein
MRSEVLGCVRIWAVVLLLGACGGASSSVETAASSSPASSDAPTCARVAGHMADLVASGIDPAPPDEDVNALIALVRTRCEDDGWSAEARRCLGTMQTATEADDCGTLLTEAQLAALLADQEAHLRGAGASAPAPTEKPAGR